jgi:hypothetical protein
MHTLPAWRTLPLNIILFHFFSISLKTRLLSPPPPLFAIALGEPLARFDELDDVDPLLAEHDGEGDDGEDPGDGRVHFIRTAKHISIVSHDRTYASTPTYYVGRMETEVR